MEGWFFYPLATLSVISALLTVTRRDAVTSAFWLIFCFTCVAALFALLSAHFIAVLQILLYAGAIMVFFLFVIMFMGESRRTGMRRGWMMPFLALATVVVVGLAMVGTMRSDPTTAVGEPPLGYGTVELVSELLLTRYTLAFEITGLLLLVAVIGAVMLARRQTPAILPYVRPVVLASEEKNGDHAADESREPEEAHA